VRTASTSLLTDPVFTSHAGPFGRVGPRRVRAPALTIDGLPPLDVVVVSHNHYDHLQPASLRAIEARHRPEFVTMLGLGPYLRRLGLSRVVELDWWESVETAKGTRMTSVPARHFSARTPFDRNETLWGGFVVTDDQATIYFVGDTAYSRAFAEIRRRVPPIDLALVPIGAYEPRWFMQSVHARVSVAMHFGTFQLTDEGIDEPRLALERALRAAGVASDVFRVLEVGATLHVEGGQPPFSPR
jgi:L-ascorbate metabolism protein UlaG (beta-lactamase superfamily)